VAGKPVAVSPVEFLQLIAEPLRWTLLQELARSDRRVGELTELLDRPQNLVSYHLGQLRKAGLITSRRSNADGRDTYYRVDLDHVATSLAHAGAALHPAIDLALVPRAPIAERRTRRRASVLFLCTGNSARSQLAEAIIRRRSQQTIAAYSAGSHPKPLHPNAIRVLAERSIDASQHTSKHFDRFAHRRFTHVITLCDRVKEICPTFPGRPARAHWSIADPAAGTTDLEASYPAFVHTADEIETRVDHLIAQIADIP
jgi:protein-tyrosine-phosphatase/DNA-binding transcriptional ArsR family regulator